MALDKAIAAGKERRKPYRGSAAFDSTCRCGGRCPWCVGNRTRQARLRDEEARDALREAFPPSPEQNNLTE